jgi:sugar O-acyltransferase (sialic acid O-acetyltransferase NeuD family)
MKKDDLIIIGSGGHARVVIDTAEQSGFNILGIIDINYKNNDEKIIGYNIIGNFTALSKFLPNKTSIIIALGDSKLRSKFFYNCLEQGYNLPSIIHPTSIISKHVKIGKSVFINAGVIINSEVDIGDNSIINTGAIIDHECNIGKHCHIGPGVKVAGRVRIGEHTFVGIGSTIIDKITIGNNVMIGAGSVIIRDIESDSTVVGIPGKRIK